MFSTTLRPDECPSGAPQPTAPVAKSSWTRS
jgi:hypothetical protein